MAHFAQMNGNAVGQIIVVDNEYAPDEPTGQAFIASIGLTGEWKMCSYNTHNGIHTSGGVPYRGNYPGSGYTYDEVGDVFVPPGQTYDNKWKVFVPNGTRYNPIKKTFETLGDN